MTDILDLLSKSWPKCAKKGCSWPGFFRVQIGDAAGPFWAYLCVSCIREVRECMAALAELSEDERRRLGEEGIPRIEEK